MRLSDRISRLNSMVGGDLAFVLPVCLHYVMMISMQLVSGMRSNAINHNPQRSERGASCYPCSGGHARP
ncbi:hypothetical protein EMEDMD4_70063 [Sinorhizobium medicae]|uniref:Uncharacterized protein n=1 Tax=Sinorhizobium medicae TaxID=110321 RepID=A0A508X9E5_9HYPH|nr:hypothetical protein EMEDMD4_70063 [Sinorhizobium medicae]